MDSESIDRCIKSSGSGLKENNPIRSFKTCTMKKKEESSEGAPSFYAGLWSQAGDEHGTNKFNSD